VSRANSASHCVRELMPSEMGLWDSFVSSSGDGTVFATSAHLEAIGAKYAVVAVWEGSRIVAGAVCVEDVEHVGSMRLEPVPLTPYHGIAFAPMEDSSSRHRISMRNKLASTLIGSLADRYRSMRMSHLWTVSDLRPFNWFRDEHNPAARFTTEVWYTSLLSLDPESLWSGMRPGHRQAFALARRTGLSTTRIQGSAEALSMIEPLWRETFSRQGKDLGNDHLVALRSVVETAERTGSGRCFATSDRAGCLSVSYMLVDTRRAYYLVGASSQDGLKSGAAVHNLLSAFGSLWEEGVAQVDMVGVNSPTRGAFKLGFGGELVPYYVTTLIR